MYLGLDLGTSGLKAVLIDEAGKVVGQENAPVSVSNPKPLWSEQDPLAWWDAAVKAVAGLKAQVGDLSGVKSVGIAGQMHGATLLDADNNILRPCILWNDGRCFEECAELEAAVPNFQELSGNLAMPGFTAPKLMWVKKHEPEVFEKVAKVLLPKDYLAFRLTGNYSGDMSDGAGTLWLDPAKRAWSEELLAGSGMTADQMPTVYEGTDVVGSITADAAAALGLPEVPVVAGAGDNAAGAVGVGVTEPGQAFLSLGTSGVYFSVSDSHCASPENTVHAFCHCLPGRWHQMTVSLSAANSLSWFADLVKTEVPALLEELAESGITQTPVTFLPYLSGERTPHNDPTAVGAFYGMTNGTTRAEMTLAVLEGVAYSFADGQDALEAAGTKIDNVTLIGGGARSPIWRQMLADILERPLTFRDGGEVGPGLGAARLAQLGVAEEFNSELLARVCPPPPVVAEHAPNAEMKDYYQKQLGRYRELYKLTKSLNG